MANEIQREAIDTYVFSCSPGIRSLPKSFLLETFLLMQVPPEIQGLTQEEEVLIARARPLMSYVVSGDQQVMLEYVVSI